MLKINDSRYVFPDINFYKHHPTNFKPFDIKLSKLNWTACDVAQMNKFNKWRKTTGNESADFIHSLPSEWERYLNDKVFSMNMETLNEIRFHILQGINNSDRSKLTYIHDNYTFASTVKSFEIAFRILADCLYDEEKSTWASDSEKNLIASLMLFRFWAHQVDVHKVWEFSLIDDLEKKFSDSYLNPRKGLKVEQPLPSRFQIGDKVLLNFSNGNLIKNAQVVGTYFNEGKVLYDIEVNIDSAVSPTGFANHREKYCTTVLSKIDSTFVYPLIPNDKLALIIQNLKEHFKLLLKSYTEQKGIDLAMPTNLYTTVSENRRRCKVKIPNLSRANSLGYMLGEGESEAAIKSGNFVYKYGCAIETKIYEHNILPAMTLIDFDETNQKSDPSQPSKIKLLEVPNHLVEWEPNKDIK